MEKKLFSRKFIISVAAFLGSIATTIAGFATDHEILATIGIVCGAISAAIYAAAEAYVDAASASSSTQSTVTTVSASSSSAEVVKSMLNSEKIENTEIKDGTAKGEKK